MNMKLLSLLFVTLLAWNASAQTAKSVLDKTAGILSKGAVTATFSAKGNMGASNGSITTQGNKFVLSSPQARIWFDGKTEWALAQGSNEVNITQPGAAEIASMNPMNFVYLYKRGYQATLSDKGGNHEVRLVARHAKASIKEMYVTIGKGNHLPSAVRIRTGANQWTTIAVQSLQITAKKKDDFFRFNPKDYPKVDVVDLR